MADILSGSSEHASFAPLSKSQTVDICQHLAEQIRQLQGQVSDLRHDLGENKKDVSSVRLELGSTDARTVQLQESFMSVNATADSNAKAVSRACANIHMLQAGLERCDENGASLGEALRLANASTQKVSRDLARTTAAADALRQDVEQRLGGNFEKLQDQVGSLELKMRQFGETTETEKRHLQEQRDGLRGANATLQGQRDDLAKTNAVVQLLEQRLSQKSESLKAAKLRLEETAGIAAKVYEDHEAMKSDLARAWHGIKTTGAKVNELSDGFDRTSKEISTLQEKLEGTCADLGSTRQAIDETRSVAKHLKEGQQMANASIRNLAADLEDTRIAARCVKASLKETQAIVLPNLTLDRDLLKRRSQLSAASTSASSTPRTADESIPESCKPMGPAFDSSSQGVGDLTSNADGLPFSVLKQQAVLQPHPPASPASVSQRSPQTARHRHASVGAGQGRKVSWDPLNMGDRCAWI